MKKIGRRILMVLGTIVLVLAVVLIVKHEAARMLIHSVWEPETALHVDGWEGGTAYRNVQYSAVSETDYLNLYVPDGDAPAPLIVLVHGGGFVLNDCESRQAQLFYQYFRDHGYACATVNYRLAQEASFPAAVEDVKCAVRYLRANADVYGYDADRIAIWGESAGGYLATMAAVTAEDEFSGLPFIGEEELDGPVSGKIDVLLDFYGAMVLEPQADRLAAFQELGMPGFIVTLSNMWLLDMMKDYPQFETWEDLWIGRNMSEMTGEERRVYSPAYYVRKNLSADSGLKVVVWHGDADITVPRTQSEMIYDAYCETIGAENAQLRILHNYKHASDKFYTDENLGELRAQLDGILGRA